MAVRIQRRGPERLLLFDVDGTMVSCGPQVRPLFEQSLVDVFGTAGACDRYDFAGKTDPRIVLDLMTEAGIAEEEVRRLLPELRRLYLGRLEDGLDGRRMRLLPGVVEILERHAARPDLALALLTGNWEPGARTKLSRFDLNRFFPFGAFGCDGTDREELPPVALNRAEEQVGRRFPPEKVLIIGDSLNDVACAHAHGIPCLAVATGRTSAGTLRAAGAEWVVPDLPAALELIDWL